MPAPLALTPFTDFADAFDAARYRPVPNDWSVAVSDVVSSTAAINAGRYKDVNLAGAATIACIVNATGREDLPFAFGGDGADVLLPPELVGTAANAMRATQRMCREIMGLTLRGAIIPMAEIRKRGRDVLVAAHDLGKGRVLAMLAGGGIETAETLCKSPEGTPFALAESNDEADLSGLSCRFEPLTPAHGAIMALVVHAKNDSSVLPSIYRDIYARIANVTRDAPIRQAALHLKWSPSGRAREAALTAQSKAKMSTAKILFEVALEKASLWTGWKPGGFDARAYTASLPAHSDYRKYADSLRMVLDCTAQQAQSIRAMLADECRKGAIDFGTHIADAALMTCFVRSTEDAGHIHFIDGAQGGYALAAAEMKQRMTHP